MLDMMKRVNDGLPSDKWINTSVGVVNTNNKNATALASIRLMQLRHAKKTAYARSLEGKEVAE